MNIKRNNFFSKLNLGLIAGSSALTMSLFTTWHISNIYNSNKIYQENSNKQFEEQKKINKSLAETVIILSQFTNNDKIYNVSNETLSNKNVDIVHKTTPEFSKLIDNESTSYDINKNIIHKDYQCYILGELDRETFFKNLENVGYPAFNTIAQSISVISGYSLEESKDMVAGTLAFISASNNSKTYIKEIYGENIHKQIFSGTLFLSVLTKKESGSKSKGTINSSGYLGKTQIGISSLLESLDRLSKNNNFNKDIETSKNFLSETEMKYIKELSTKNYKKRIMSRRTERGSQLMKFFKKKIDLIALDMKNKYPDLVKNVKRQNPHRKSSVEKIISYRLMKNFENSIYNYDFYQKGKYGNTLKKHIIYSKIYNKIEELINDKTKDISQYASTHFIIQDKREVRKSLKKVFENINKYNENTLANLLYQDYNGEKLKAKYGEAVEGYYKEASEKLKKLYSAKNPNDLTHLKSVQNYALKINGSAGIQNSRKPLSKNPLVIESSKHIFKVINALNDLKQKNEKEIIIASNLNT